MGRFRRELDPPATRTRRGLRRRDRLVDETDRGIRTDLDGCGESDRAVMDDPDREPHLGIITGGLDLGVTHREVLRSDRLDPDLGVGGTGGRLRSSPRRAPSMSIPWELLELIAALAFRSPRRGDRKLRE